MTTVTTEFVSALANWSAEKRLQTKLGDRRLKTAPATEKFWQAWRQHKEELKTLGVSCGKDRDTGEWQANWWLPLEATEQASRAASEQASRATDADIPIPLPPGQALMPFQRAGVAYALARKNTLFGDEMGLGKTVQAIAVCNATSPRRVLIVCPASLKINWAREWAKFSTLTLSVGMANGVWPDPEPDVVIVNYDILAKHADRIAAVQWDVLIVDECHYAKNPKTKRGKAIAQIEAARKLYLSGTPLVNRPMELWPLASKLAPQEFDSWIRFRGRYAEGRNLDELQRRLRSTIMVRRLKRDVLAELPPKTRQIVELPITDATRPFVNRMAELEKVLHAIPTPADNETPEQYETRLAGMAEAQRAAFTELSRIRHELAFAKVPQVIDHIREAFDAEADDYKIVVFAHHTDVIDAIMGAFSDLCPVRVTGQDSIADRQQSVDAFQKDGRVRLFVGNIRAAGVGLTLTKSSHVIFAELDWTPAAMSQAEDRCHRIGQADNVLVQHLVVDGSLDVMLARTIIDKQRIADAAMDKRTAAMPEHVDMTPDAIAKRAQEIEAARLAEIEAKRAAAVAADAARVAEREAADAAKRAAAAPAPAQRNPDGSVPLSDASGEIVLTPERIAWAQLVLRTVAGMDTDRATERNGMGFNKFDNDIGHSLAGQTFWTPRQAVTGVRLALKYRNQAPFAGGFPQW